MGLGVRRIKWKMENENHKKKAKPKKCRNCGKLFVDNKGFYDRASCSKKCYNEYMKNWRENNSSYHRKWKEKNPNYMKEWWVNHQGYLNKWMKKNNFKERYKEIIEAGRIANKSIKIPNGYKCEVCNKNLAINRHHEDYSKPLQVILCCKSCHGLLDRERHKREEKLKC